ncbi:hypothetical protein TWF718_009835 [Orbilia javanica]|uniref:Uncharacterized protein n=1 Tax=Orbilia javanica TaxID=47235 RepID=A0AAN8MX99_9PEZI
MNVARLFRPRHFPARPLLSRPLATPRAPPINGTIQQQLNFLIVEPDKALGKINVKLGFINIAMGGIYAAGAGLLVWFIQDTITESKKNRHT